MPSAPDERVKITEAYASLVARDAYFWAWPLVNVYALDISPVVIQVPDFGERFWVYQVVDTRTDSFVQLGKMYGTTPGFYLLVGPNWQGEVPRGITKVFRSATSTGFVAPRIFQMIPRRTSGQSKTCCSR
jgi:hypothetical protein